MLTKSKIKHYNIHIIKILGVFKWALDMEIRGADIDQVAVITLDMPPSFSIIDGFAERVNLKMLEIKRIAKGFANINNLILMIYFHLGYLGFPQKPLISFN